MKSHQCIGIHTTTNFYGGEDYDENVKTTGAFAEYVVILEQGQQAFDLFEKSVYPKILLDCSRK